MVVPRLTRVTELARSLPAGFVEMPALGMQLCDSPSTATNAKVFCPCATALVVARVPARVHHGRPLDIELATVGRMPGIDATVSLAHWLSAYARLGIAVDVPGCPCEILSLPVTVFHHGDVWILRALMNPVTWATAGSVSLTSITLAGRPLLHECLPAILHVGFNHEPAHACAVHSAAQAGDVLAVQAALDAGGSTEEADEVCRTRGWLGHTSTTKDVSLTSSTCIAFHTSQFPCRDFSPHFVCVLSRIWQGGRTAVYLASYEGHLEVIRTLLAAGANASTADVVSEWEGGPGAL